MRTAARQANRPQAARYTRDARRRRGRSLARGAAGFAFTVGLAGCSIKQMAIKQIGSALSEGANHAFASESDVEFAGQAAPFSLKLIETLLYDQPDDLDLLLAAAAGFAQYAFVWVQQPGDFVQAEDFAAAQHQYDRAREFYLRAHRYATHGLEVKHPGFLAQFERDPAAAVAVMRAEDVPLLYWSAISLGGAISLGKADPELIAHQPQLEALVDRAFALDPDWGDGALHELLMSYELARPGLSGEEAQRRSRAHLEAVLRLSHGHRVAPLVTFAEAVCVQQQNKKEFLDLLHRALAIDPDDTPDNRLANVVMQQRARWLLGRVDELFLE